MYVSVSVCVCVCVYSRACLLYVEYIAQKSAIFCDGIIFMLASHISFLTFAPCCRRHSSMYIVFYVATTDIYRFICFCFFLLYHSPSPLSLSSSLSHFYLSIYLTIFPCGLYSIKLTLVPIIFHCGNGEL